MAKKNAFERIEAQIETYNHDLEQLPQSHMVVNTRKTEAALQKELDATPTAQRISVLEGIQDKAFDIKSWYTLLITLLSLPLDFACMAKYSEFLSSLPRTDFSPLGAIPASFGMIASIAIPTLIYFTAGRKFGDSKAQKYIEKELAKV